MLIGAASYHYLMRRPTMRRLERALPLDELLAELRKPEVKAQILAETDLPIDPQRQFEALTERRAVPLRPHLRARRPAGLRADRRPLDHRRSPPRRVVDPWEVFYDRRRVRRTDARRVHQLRRGVAGPPGPDDRPPRHRHRAVRRRRPRADDLRRVDADVPADALGARPLPWRAAAARVGGAQADRADRAGCRSRRPGHDRDRQASRPERHRPRVVAACTHRARSTTCPPAVGGCCRTPPATSPRWSPAS